MSDEPSGYIQVPFYACKNHIHITSPDTCSMKKDGEELGKVAMDFRSMGVELTIKGKKYHVNSKDLFQALYEEEWQS